VNFDVNISNKLRNE